MGKTQVITYCSTFQVSLLGEMSLWHSIVQSKCSGGLANSIAAPCW